MSRTSKDKRSRSKAVEPAPPRAQRRAALIALAAAGAVCLIAAGVAYFPRDQEAPPSPAPTGGAPRAVIVDQLNLSFPNPAFVQKATELLRAAGYAVDYCPGENVTVEFYRNLPSQGYGLVVMRVHSALLMLEGVLTNEVLLFTAEPYDAGSHLHEQRTRQLAVAHYAPDGGPLKYYFGVMAAFIDSSMRGRFENATVILMGCYSFRSQELAEALRQKGAQTVIGWDGAVSASHTDAATERLLEHLLVEKLPAAEAARRAAEESGEDPTYGSKLVVYPLTPGPRRGEPGHWSP